MSCQSSIVLLVLKALMLQDYALQHQKIKKRRLTPAQFCQITLKKLAIGSCSASLQVQLIPKLAADGQVIKIIYTSSGNFKPHNSGCKSTCGI